MRALFLVGCLGLTFACGTVMSQRRNVQHDALELNTATRFGQLDHASHLASPEAKKTFLERRRTWGDEIRILDVQVSHINVKTTEDAEVTVLVDWTRANEGLLRSTVLSQQWHSEGQGPWRLQAERQIRGDRGLFGEKVQAKHLAPARDTQFQSRSLGTVDE